MTNMGKNIKSLVQMITDALKVIKKIYKSVTLYLETKKVLKFQKKEWTDMGFKISFVPALERDKWLDKRYWIKKLHLYG